MTSETQSAPSLFIATTTFQTTIHGVEEWITQGQIAEPNSWPVRHWPDAFVPLAIDYPADLKRGRATTETLSPAALLKRRGGRRAPEQT